jgi:chorismate mutase-like protein
MTKAINKTKKQIMEAAKNLSEKGDRQLDQLRRQIDAIDAKIVDLLNRRSRVALRIGAHKRANGGALYAPEREQAVLARVRAINRGPLPNSALEAIYREIMSAALALEGPFKIGVAGPAGGTVAIAARNHFGAAAKQTAVRSASEAVAGILKGRWDAICIADADLPAACAELQAGKLLLCGRASKGVSILVRAPSAGPHRSRAPKLC